MLILHGLTISKTVSRIGLVKPQKARQITDLLIRMAQSGQIRGKITEAQLIDLLDQVDQANSADSGAGKITVGAIAEANIEMSAKGMVLNALLNWNLLTFTVHKEEDGSGRRRQRFRFVAKTISIGNHSGVHSALAERGED